MRLGVLDVGSNTVHLLVVDAHPGARPWPAYSHKLELRLAEHLATDGSIDVPGADKLVSFVGECLDVARREGTEDLLAFATSAIRDAPNGEDVLARVCHETGIDMRVLGGNDEARLTFLAVRRWSGWSAGRLLVLDIGGGSLEIACGIDEEPDVATSLPLGAGRLTRECFSTDPPKAKEVKVLRRYVRAELAEAVRRLRAAGEPDRAVATSKTFRQLARIAGAAASDQGPYVRRFLSREDLRRWADRLAEMRSEQRAGLPGVSVTRAPQLLAGALVAEAAVELLDIVRLEICPWALREGVILRRLDWMQG